MSAANGQDDRRRLEDALGHRFSDQELLDQALRHSSSTRKRVRSNERLEFLGDRVLGLVLAMMLYEEFEHEEEGDLGYRYTALAQRDALARVAAAVDLVPHLVLSEGEAEAGGRDNPSIHADALEAVIAALFLDGGLAAAEAFIRRHWAPLMAEAPTPPKDPKTTLQEWAQARALPLPVYKVRERAGPDHAPLFTVEVIVETQRPETGAGPTKRAAEQAAAEAMLNVIETGQT